MRFKNLGKTHYVCLFGVFIRAIYLVSGLGAVMAAFLAKVWGLSPFPWSVTTGLCVLLACSIAKASEVPFTREIIHHKLKGRVSVDD